MLTCPGPLACFAVALAYHFIYHFQASPGHQITRPLIYSIYKIILYVREPKESVAFAANEGAKLVLTTQRRSPYGSYTNALSLGSSSLCKFLVLFHRTFYVCAAVVLLWSQKIVLPHMAFVTNTAADSFATDSIREAVFSRKALAFARYQRTLKAKRITGQVIAFFRTSFLRKGVCCSC
jgi:hypothetical protein